MGSYLELKKSESGMLYGDFCEYFMNFMHLALKYYCGVLAKYNSSCTRLYNAKVCSGLGDKYIPPVQYANTVDRSFQDLKSIQEPLHMLGIISINLSSSSDIATANRIGLDNTHVVVYDYKLYEHHTIIANMCNWLDLEPLNVSNIEPEPLKLRSIGIRIPENESVSTMRDFSAMLKADKLIHITILCEAAYESIENSHFNNGIDTIGMKDTLEEMNAISEKYAAVSKWIAAEEQYKVIRKPDKEMQNRSRPFLYLSSDIRIDGKRNRFVNPPMKGVKL